MQSARCREQKAGRTVVRQRKVGWDFAREVQEREVIRGISDQGAQGDGGQNSVRAAGGVKHSNEPLAQIPGERNWEDYATGRRGSSGVFVVLLVVSEQPRCSEMISRARSSVAQAVCDLASRLHLPFEARFEVEEQSKISFVKCS